MSGSSSDSEDKNIAMLRQAVDTDFISDEMFSKGISIFLLFIFEIYQISLNFIWCSLYK